MSKINLKKLQEVGDKATEGPWHDDHDLYDSGAIYGRDGCVVSAHHDGNYISDIDWHGNKEFVMESRNHWDEIMEALEEAKEIIKGDEFQGRNDDETVAVEKWLGRFEDE